MHPLHQALVAAAGGEFPPVDGLAEVHRPSDDDGHAVVEFTGHAFVLTTHDPVDVIGAGADGFGGATQPDLLRFLAGPDGWIGSHDVVLAGCGSGDAGDNGGGRGGLPAIRHLEDHPRVQRSRAHRRHVRVHGDEHGLVTIGHGLVGRLEISVEVIGRRSAGQGARLIEEGLSLVPAGELVWAQVAAGNAASLRAFLRCGFVPIGAEVLLHRGPGRHTTVTR